jgi:hypothetical protein
LTGGTLTGGLIGTTGSFSSSGSGDTFTIGHTSGSGIALNITKGGNGEGLYINKTSGSGNAATIIGTLNATTLVKSGGTASQFLKADGSIDSSTYLTTSAASSTYLPLSGGTLTGALSGTSATFSGSVTAQGGYFYGQSTNSFVRLDNTIGTQIGFLNYADITFDSDGLRFYTGTGTSGSRTQKFFIASTGAAFFSNTGSASYGLTVANSSDNLRLRLGTTTGGYLNIQGQITSSGNPFNMSLQADGGNVGIGTSSPAAKLEIQDGHVRLYDPVSTAGAGYAVIWASNNGGTNTSFATIEGVTTSAGNRTGDIKFNTSSAGSPTERMRITSGYSVSVPNAVPTTLFNINSVLTVGSMALVTVYASSGPGLGMATLVIMRDGNGGVSQAQIGIQPTAAYLTFTISGTNLQVTAAIGPGTHTIQGSVLRISS